MILTITIIFPITQILEILIIIIKINNDKNSKINLKTNKKMKGKFLIIRIKKQRNQKKTRKRFATISV